MKRVWKQIGEEFMPEEANREEKGNLILSEREASRKYELKILPRKIKGKSLVRITRNNVARAEAMVRTDSDYRIATDPRHEKSSAYLIRELKPLLESKRTEKKKYNELIENIIIRLDNENSTHLNSDGVGRQVIRDRILKVPRKKLVEYLRYPEKTNFELIRIIAKKTVPKDTKHNGRENPSFASKFCHYMCFYLFEGMKEQDNYPIFDSVISESLPYYLEYYDLGIRNLKDYVEYRQAIDDVIEAAGGGISRNGLDHLLWYYFK